MGKFGDNNNFDIIELYLSGGSDYYFFPFIWLGSWVHFNCMVGKMRISIAKIKYR